MRQSLIYIFQIIFLFSCKEEKKELLNAKPYRVIFQQLMADTAISSILYSNGYYLCLQENHRVAVFDKLYKRNFLLEDSINIFPIYSLYKNDDTTFLMNDNSELLGYPKKEFYFTNNFKIKSKRFDIWECDVHSISNCKLFEDSEYSIYANQIGEWGFMLFFYNKRLKKIYAVWSRSPRQIIKFKNSYFIAQDGDFTITPAFSVVVDPTKLIEINFDEARKLCQLMQHLSASPGKYYENLKDSIRNTKVNIYGENEGKHSVPVYTFSKLGNMYSIIRNDSSIYLVIHKDDSLFKVQTILDSPFLIDNINYQMIKQHHFITFGNSGSKTVNNKMVDYSNYGFMVIKDSSIDILQYYIQKPWKE